MKFDLHLIVPTKLVGPIVELLENDGVLIKIEPHHNTHKRPRKGGEGSHGGKGVDLIRSFIASFSPGSQFTSRDVVKFFKANGSALGSASSRLSYAKQQGLVKSLGFGRYEVKP
jgi:hypothetical protein